MAIPAQIRSRLDGPKSGFMTVRFSAITKQMSDVLVGAVSVMNKEVKQERCVASNFDFGLTEKLSSKA
jgi:hypothetical protein